MGFYIGLQEGRKSTESVVEVTPDSTCLSPADTTATDSISVVEDTPDTLSQPAVTKPEEQPAEQKIETPAPAKAETPKPAAEDKYAAMDARVKHGAYRIVGDDFTVTVRPGETTARIAKRTLGAGMECYIEVYNGIKSNTELKAGQTIKIPKLEWKKKKKKL